MEGAEREEVLEKGNMMGKEILLILILVVSY